MIDGVVLPFKNIGQLSASFWQRLFKKRKKRGEKRGDTQGSLLATEGSRFFIPPGTLSLLKMPVLITFDSTLRSETMSMV